MIYLLNTSPFGGFTSQVSLKDAKILKACYIESRCKSMLLIYDEDTRSTLGQWYESAHAQPDIQAIAFQRDNVLRFYHTQHEDNQFLSRVESLSGASFFETSDTFVDMVYGVSA
jgi:hypothetical protein